MGQCETGSHGERGRPRGESTVDEVGAGLARHEAGARGAGQGLIAGARAHSQVVSSGASLAESAGEGIIGADRTGHAGGSGSSGRGHSPRREGVRRSICSYRLFVVLNQTWHLISVSKPVQRSPPSLLLGN